MNHENVLRIIDNLTQVFGVVLGLSLAEAFKQCVPETASGTEVAAGADRREHTLLRWNRLSALLAFMLLLTPFYQGMSRYLYYEYYESGRRPQPYGTFLLMDCAFFTIEAGFFFVMSRSLSELQWRRFYRAVLLIFIADGIWGLFVWLSHRWPDRHPDIVPWLILDAVALAAFAAILMIFRTYESRWGPRVGLAAMAIRTAADYWTSWRLYFPK